MAAYLGFLKKKKKILQCFIEPEYSHPGCVTNFQVPVRLHEKILELQDPVVGLAYIEELIPENDPEVLLSYYYRHIPCISPALYFYCGIVCKTNSCALKLKHFHTPTQMEPHYTCQLCGSTGPANGMFTHLMGGNHRLVINISTRVKMLSKNIPLSFCV